MKECETLCVTVKSDNLQIILSTRYLYYTVDWFKLLAETIMADNDPSRRIVGPNGCEYLEMWCKHFVSLCIVTTKQPEPLCEHEELKPPKKLGIQPQVFLRD